MVDSPYPANTNGFRRLILSDQYPENTFNSEAVVSAAPSTRPITHALAPNDSKNKGTTGKIIWLLRSVNRLTKPTMMIFLPSPLKNDCLFIHVTSEQSSYYGFYSSVINVAFCIYRFSAQRKWLSFQQKVIDLSEYENDSKKRKEKDCLFKENNIQP
jgi:hypothetical protein